MITLPQSIIHRYEAGIKREGIECYSSQKENHQVVFRKFSKDIELDEHFHEEQWSIVLKGKIDLMIDGKKQTFSKGDLYLISEGAKHSGKIYTGYSDLTYFEPNQDLAIKHLTNKCINI